MTLHNCNSKYFPSLKEIHLKPPPSSNNCSKFFVLHHGKTSWKSHLCLLTSYPIFNLFPIFYILASVSTAPKSAFINDPDAAKSKSLSWPHLIDLPSAFYVGDNPSPLIDYILLTPTILYFLGFLSASLATPSQSLVLGLPPPLDLSGSAMDPFSSLCTPFPR